MSGDELRPDVGVHHVEVRILVRRDAGRERVQRAPSLVHERAIPPEPVRAVALKGELPGLRLTVGGGLGATGPDGPDE